MVSQQNRGWALSETFKGGGNKEYPHKSIELKDPHLPAYLVIWGDI